MKNILILALFSIWASCTNTTHPSPVASTDAAPAVSGKMPPAAGTAPKATQPSPEMPKTPAKVPQKTAVPPAGSTPATAGEALVWATDLDLICHMRVERTTPDTAHYKGKIYGFCCPGCKESFQEDPQHWLEAMLE